MSPRSFPYVVCYPGLVDAPSAGGATGAELCVDASASRNDARFVRQSCTSNARLVHVVEPSAAVRFYICATRNIAEGREVTIPFNYDYRKV